jgi:cytochrome c-type biogenesis protein CcmH
MFWALAALFVVAALAFVLPALLGRRSRSSRASTDAANIAIYRDQLRELDADLAAGTLGREQYDEARRELERRMLDDVATPAVNPSIANPGRRTALAVGISIPLAATLLYIAIGSPQALAPSAPGEHEQGVTRQQIESMVERLAARMKETPDDVKGWIMLGRSYAVLDRFPESVAAYENAIKRAPPDAQLLADYADVLAMVNDRSLIGAPEKVIAQALQLDPNNLKALALAGTVSFQKKDFNDAIVKWERILKLVPPDSDMADSVRDSIEDARKLAGTPGQAPAAKAPESPVKQVAVSGKVSLAPALAAKVAPDDMVFVFARPVDGSRMPLAVLRKRARDLPIEFRLDDSLAMTPAGRISNYTQVVVGARVSKSGNPVPKAGDLEGLTTPVRVGDDKIVVTIDTEVR